MAWALWGLSTLVAAVLLLGLTTRLIYWPIGLLAALAWATLLPAFVATALAWSERGGALRLLTSAWVALLLGVGFYAGFGMGQLAFGGLARLLYRWLMV